MVVITLVHFDSRVFGVSSGVPPKVRPEKKKRENIVSFRLQSACSRDSGMAAPRDQSLV